MEFKITHKDKGTAARTGRLIFDRGEVSTPVFLPVATRGSVRCVSSEDLLELGHEMVLANAYHLSMRPGTGVVAAAGGLHSFMNWPRPILTDSGGFQIFSIEGTRVEDAGVDFRSIYDGSRHRITPEEAIAIQEDLGAEVIMPLDQPAAYPVARAAAEEALARTTAWAARCKAAHRLGGQALFGIVQGATYPDLRKRSVEEIAGIGFPGYSLGGFCLGEPKNEMNELVAYTAGLLPTDKPRYLMGIGTAPEIISAVEAGVDVFDCAFPTHIARNGSALTGRGRLIIRNAAYRQDSGPLDPECGCFVCRNYRRDYLRHLFNTRELTVLRLVTYHNLYFMQDLMRRIREAVAGGDFPRFQREFVEKWSSGI